MSAVEEMPVSECPVVPQISRKPEISLRDILILPKREEVRPYRDSTNAVYSRENQNNQITIMDSLILRGFDAREARVIADDIQSVKLGQTTEKGTNPEEPEYDLHFMKELMNAGLLTADLSYREKVKEIFEKGNEQLPQSAVDQAQFEVFIRGLQERKKGNHAPLRGFFALGRKINGEWFRNFLLANHYNFSLLQQGIKGDVMVPIVTKEGEIDWEKNLKELKKPAMLLLIKKDFNIEDREDLFQDLAEKMFKKIKTFHIEEGNFVSWALTILNNTAIDLLRQRRRKAVGVALNPNSSTVIKKTASDEPDEIAVRNDEEQKIRAIVGELPPNQAEVIDLYHFNDLSYSEISQRIGERTSTVRMRLYRARNTLRSLLEEQTGD